MTTTADIIIIGGGVMGTSIAYHLARRGAGRIVLLEREPFFGQGATGKCAGGIRHQFSSEVNIRLSTLSIQMLERFPEEMEQEISLNQCGYLFLLSNPADMAAFEQNVALQRSLGIETELLTPAEIQRLAPQVDLAAPPAIIGGTFYGRDGLCDPNSVVQGYVRQARRLGVELRSDTAVTELLTDGARVTGVMTAAGPLYAPVVVLAAGPWSAPVAATAGVELPVLPVRRQIAVTRVPEIPRDFPFVIDFAQALYFHYETGGILTGMSNRDETPGDKSEVDSTWTLHHLERAVERLPLLAEAELIAEWAGLYEVTPDHQPIIGPLPVAGLYSCAGFSGHGFMQGPICGLLMAEMILDGAARTVDISSLDYQRFGLGAASLEQHIV